MHHSIHYYVLALGRTTVKLYEGFRDMLIEIESGGFPLDFSPPLPYSAKATHEEKRLQVFYERVDQFFTLFYDQDPLGLILVGEHINQAIFRSMSVYAKDIFGELEGHYEATSTHDLGQIVWPIVREVLSGHRERTLRELDKAVNAQNIVSGLDAVWRLANSVMGADLLVEEDYHVKGSIVQTDHSWIILPQVDLREVFDDVVDSIIEKVLETNGNVIFLDRGSLAAYQRIALIQR